MRDHDPADDGVPADRWHGEPPGVWQRRWGIPQLRIFRSVGSTNDVARALAEAGAPHGAAVIAETQTRGRGRRGRGWHGTPGQSLLLSLVLRPAGGAAAVLPLRVGLAVAEAIEGTAPVAVRIKWPNDLLIGHRKVGGILCEGAVEGGRGTWVVAGIGLNVLQGDRDWPADLAADAVSIAAAAGTTVDLPTLAERVIAGVCMAPTSPGLEAPELEELARRDCLRGRVVTVDGMDAGRATGIDPDGALRVDAGGSTRRITAGTVRPADDGAIPRSDP